MPVARGSTFVLTRATGSTPHLWVVISDPVGEPPEVVLVNLTTLRPHSDETVVLHPGDHPFIKHPTCAYFSDARIVSVSSLKDALQRGQAIPREDAAEEIVERMRAGLLASRSPFTRSGSAAACCSSAVER